MYMMKLFIMLGAGIGGVAGAYVPFLWGDTDFFSPMSILLSTIGAIVGIVLGYKIAKRLGA